MANLGPQKQSTSYLGLLQVPDGLTTVLKNVTDGLGASSPLQLSTTSIGFSSLTMTGPINMGGYQINNLGAPSFSTDAATKAYVDSVATGLQPKTQCVAGTVSDITLSGEQTIDDIAVVAGDRVLVKNQAIQANNGIYIVSASAWTRSSDADTWAELVGAYVFIVGGTVNTATSWVCNSPVVGTLGVTAVTWIKFSSSTSTLSNFLTFDSQGDGDQGYTDILTENGYNLITEENEYITIQTPGLIQFNGSAPILISYNSIGAIALDGSNASPGSTWDISVIGNAGTVTNGVYTSESYSDPAWLTAIASSKLIGAVAVNRGGTGATTLSGILLGNGSSPVTTATATDIVSAIGSTAVANATNAVNATTATTAITATTATTTTQTDFSNLTIDGSQVISVSNLQTQASGKASINGSIVAGAQTRLVMDMFGDYLNILDFGADPTAVTDSTTAIQNALNAASTAPSGKKIYFPAGYYKITSTLTVPSGTGLCGDSYWASKVIQYTNGIASFDCSAGFVSVDGLQIAYSTTAPSAGSTAIISGANCVYRNFLVWGCDIGIQVNGVGVFMSDFQIWNYKRIGIYFYNTNDCTINNFILNAAVGITNSGMGQLGGIRLYAASGGLCEAFRASNGGILNGVHSLTCDSASYTVRHEPEFCHFTDVFFDVGEASDGASAVAINNSGNLRFDQCYFYSPTVGANIVNANDISFDNCVFYGCGQDGSYVGSNTAFVSFTACTFENNQRAGIYLDGAWNFNITGGQAYPVSSGQQYGAFISSSCNNFNIVNFNASGNSVGNIYDLTSSSTAKTIYGCLGAITQTTAPGYIVSSVGKAAGVTYTNTKKWPIFVSVSAGNGTDSVANIIVLTVGTTQVSVSSYKTGGFATVCGFVPSGITYIVSLYGPGNSIYFWTES